MSNRSAFSRKSVRVHWQQERDQRKQQQAARVVRRVEGPQTWTTHELSVSQRTAQHGSRYLNARRFEDGE